MWDEVQSVFQPNLPANDKLDQAHYADPEFGHWMGEVMEAPDH